MAKQRFRKAKTGGSSPPLSTNAPVVQWQDSRFVIGRRGFDSVPGAPICARSSIGRAPDYESGGCRFEPCRALHSIDGQAREGLGIAGCRGFALRPVAPYGHGLMAMTAASKSASRGSIPRAHAKPTACREAWPFLPDLESGDRWFESSHADHFADIAQGQSSAMVRRRPRFDS